MFKLFQVVPIFTKGPISGSELLIPISLLLFNLTYYRRCFLATFFGNHLQSDKLLVINILNDNDCNGHIKNLISLWNHCTITKTINPFHFVLNRRVIGGKHNIWIVILQEFDLESLSSKSKKLLVFVELVSELPCEEEIVYEESFPD